MKPDEFENELARLPLRPLPAEWRQEILSAASQAGRQESTEKTDPSTPWWRELLWPCPQAWAGLAAAWVVVFILNHDPSKSAPVAEAQAPSAKAVLMGWHEHRRLQEELLQSAFGPTEASAATEPGPRSEGFALWQIV